MAESVGKTKHNSKQITEQWGTRIGIILAVAGSAVGLGNFLRFPGQAAQNGGGAFMIPYFIAFLLLGIPICWAEWTMGRRGGQFGFNSCPAIFGVIGKRRIWRYIGVIGIIIPVVVYMYYVVIESWCLSYALYYLFGAMDLGNDPALYAEKSKEFFTSAVGADADGLVNKNGGLHSSLYFWLIVFLINFYLIYHGLSRGIESFCKIAMPLMSICALIVLIRVLTLGTPNPETPELNVLNGLGFMWNPKGEGDAQWYEALLNPQVWMSATGQIFFSLSVGFGVIINYASYLKKKDDVVLSGLTASATNEFFEVCLGGLITIPAAFIFLGAAGAVGGTFGLGFNTLPVVFEYMPAGRLFGFLWFFMLFLAAITSSLSMLQPGIAFLEEGFNIKRRTSVFVLGLLTASGSLFVLYFSKDLVALDTMDFWVGTALIFVLATVQVILFGWVLGTKEGVRAAEEGAEMKLPRIFPFVIKYVSPVYLLTIFVFWCKENLPGYIENLMEGGVPLFAVSFILLVSIGFLVLIKLAGKRWDLVPLAKE